MNNDLLIQYLTMMDQDLNHLAMLTGIILPQQLDRERLLLLMIRLQEEQARPANQPSEPDEPISHRFDLELEE